MNGAHLNIMKFFRLRWACRTTNTIFPRASSYPPDGVFALRNTPMRTIP